MHLLCAARLISVVVCSPGGMTARPQAVHWDVLLQHHPSCEMCVEAPLATITRVRPGHLHRTFR